MELDNIFMEKQDNFLLKSIEKGVKIMRLHSFESPWKSETAARYFLVKTSRKHEYYVTQGRFSASSPLYHLNVLGHNRTRWSILFSSVKSLKIEMYSFEQLVWITFFSLPWKFKQLKVFHENVYILSSFKSPTKFSSSEKPFPFQKDNATMLPSIFDFCHETHLHLERISISFWQA